MVQSCNRNRMNCDLVSVLVKSETVLKRRDRRANFGGEIDRMVVFTSQVSGSEDEERRLHNWFL